MLATLFPTLLRERYGAGGARDRGGGAGRGLSRLVDPRATGHEKTGQDETRRAGRHFACFPVLRLARLPQEPRARDEADQRANIHCGRGREAAGGRELLRHRLDLRADRAAGGLCECGGARERGAAERKGSEEGITGRERRGLTVDERRSV